MHPSTGTNVHDVISSANGVFVVLHHNQRVAQIAQLKQRGQQTIVITLVQTNTRLIQHIEHAS